MSIPNRAVQNVIRDQELIDDLIMHSVSREWELPPLSGPTGVTEGWRRAFLSFRFADLIAQVETGMTAKQLSVEDRAWLKGQVESLLGDAEVYFNHPHDDGSNYQPEQEPDDSSIEEIRR